jgi:hypothetical protein
MGVSGVLIRRVAREAAWAPLAVLVGHSVVGGLLGHEPYVDPAMHFLGGLAAAFFFRKAACLARDLLGTPTALALDLFAFGMTCAVALFWEFGEYAVDELFDAHVQGGLENTVRDLILGVSGAVCYLLVRRLGRWADRSGERREQGDHARADREAGNRESCRKQAKDD